MPSPPREIDADTRAQMAEWVTMWRRVSASLEAERLDALQRLDDEESARIARDLVWPMGTLDHERTGDAAGGLVAMKDALQRLGESR